MVWDPSKRCVAIVVRWVLILLLVEYGLGSLRNSQTCRGTCLNPSFSGIWSGILYTHHYPTQNLVLILLLVEYGLGSYGWHWITKPSDWDGLNPSFIGIWSRMTVSISQPSKAVLILLLLEYGLGLTYLWQTCTIVLVLILLLVEYGLGSMSSTI